MSLNYGRLNLIAVPLISGALVMLGMQAGRARSWSPSTEIGWLRDTYGPHKHSQYDEEWIIRDFFRGKRNGVFVDVGAAHHQVYSNTYYLETQLGWSGLAIEPQRQFEEGYRRYRPRTTFLAFFVSDRSGSIAQLHLNDNPLVASVRPDFTRRWGELKSIQEAPTTTLTDVLVHADIGSVDFISMDIELSEPKALAGFDIQRFRPSLFCIEAHPEVRQAILDYFAENQYVVVGKYLRVDDRNLYFVPLGTRISPFPTDVTESWTEQ